MEDVFESNEVVRLRRNRWLLSLPVVVLLVGSILARLHRPPPEDFLERVPRTLDVAQATQPLGPELQPVVHGASSVAQQLVWAFRHPPEPKELHRQRSALRHYQLVTVIAVTLAIGIWQLNPFPRRRRGAVLARRSGLTWNGELLVEGRDLAQGVMRPGWGASSEEVVVRIERRDRFGVAYELAVSDAREGRRLLWALGVDASQVAATFFLDSLAKTTRGLKYGLWALRIGMLISAAFLVIELQRRGLGAVAVTAPGIVLFSSLSAMWVLHRWPVKVRVGTDGVLQSWLGVQRFVSYASVRSIERFEWGVRLLLDDGPPLELTVFRVSFLVPKALVQRFKGWAHWLNVRRDLLAQRIEEAMVARRSRDSLASVPGWMHRVRGEAKGDEDLHAVLEDPWRDSHARAVAALSLRDTLDEHGRDYFRALAAASASPRLREALEAIAARDENRLERALRRLRQN